MIIGYARVSDGGSQRHDLQMDALHAAGCERVFVEAASGARTDRPELRKALEIARPGDVIVTYRLDRIGRSLKHLIEIAEDLQRWEIGLRSLIYGKVSGTMVQKLRRTRLDHAAGDDPDDAGRDRRGNRVGDRQAHAAGAGDRDQKTTVLSRPACYALAGWRCGGRRCNLSA
ncbi:recombinase family protein [Pseudoroseomonas cervicalis]|uniref:Resolvase, N-terminal domain protein n=1 Tax=Pseudoroseomonas cervicalis ATCC 49957 TaxID=525371 RepID=D5RKT8_9PROT|nr:recombinase family protein [Pseudoroseomonas cervicalis]EFH12084.1 resolvase, N-terminal domain protein [Pseudoroseomonas cervicalis ATCC 49957]